jgi:transcriptional regulator with XRE-family HTH domain
MSPITIRIKELREARGWSQRELSRQSGVRQATLSAIENGETAGIDFATLEQLAETFDLDAALLIVHTRTKKIPTK